MATDAGLALFQHLREFADRQLHRAEQTQHPQPGGVACSAQYIESRDHEPGYKEIFIWRQSIISQLRQSMCHAADRATGATLVRWAADRNGRETTMKKLILLPLAAVAFSIGACSQKAQNETGEAADAVAADVNATMGEAVDDVQTAGERAIGAAENATDRAGEKIENATDRAGAAIDRGAAKADAAADNAQREAGEELEKAGRDMQR
ncbi:hypothetical protein QLH51_03330 [Sphingomonas sp. 2R-10]|uniref:hypothetical protein n=1 Tax=Sphingomonas sp. 2R-10 TaxID=3045148 RepID=UPI001F499F0C|nr:hypothetical protein [Sphingomonas sp. 2R-10]MDJ0275839.1 hypothetical protein [Sphingomonas sp. 2R-10]